MTLALQATGIRKLFGHHVALDGVDLSLRAGTTLGIVGESGSGKSTLGRILMRLTLPDTGSVTLLGEDFLGARPKRLRALRRRIQLVPQDPRNSLNPTMTVRDNLTFQLRAHMIPRAEWSQRCETALRTVELPVDYLFAYSHELSGGQAQRVAIARALLTEPAVIVCDEAVSALDKSVQAQVLNTLANLQIDKHIALAFISHDLSVVEHLADDVLVLNRGNAVESGRTSDILDAPKDPYTRALLAARMPAPHTL